MVANRQRDEITTTPYQTPKESSNDDSMPPLHVLLMRHNPSALAAHSVDPRVILSSFRKNSIFLGISMTLWAMGFSGGVPTHTAVPPSLLNHVGTIFGMSAYPKMGRIDAHRVVSAGAIVKNAHPSWNMANINFPGSSMGAPSGVPVFTISVFTLTAIPYPTSTIGRFFNYSFPETVYVHEGKYTTNNGVLV